MAIAACIVGPNVRRISKLTGLPLSTVSEYGQRLRENKVWVGGKVLTENPEEGPDGIEIAVWGLIADGMMEAVPA